MDNKYEKDEVDYSRGHKDSHCGPVFPDDKGSCRHYISKTATAGECQLVKGPINPVYWCTEWEKARR